MTSTKPELFETVVALDKAYIQMLKDTTGHLPTEMCTRCAGKGYDYFLGTHSAPGQCFKCAGKGITVKRKFVKEGQRLTKVADLWRYRCLYLILSGQLAKAKADTTTSGHWSVAANIRPLERQVEDVIRVGKELAK